MPRLWNFDCLGMWVYLCPLISGVDIGDKAVEHFGGGLLGPLWPSHSGSTGSTCISWTCDSRPAWQSPRSDRGGCWGRGGLASNAFGSDRIRHQLSTIVCCRLPSKDLRLQLSRGCLDRRVSFSPCPEKSCLLGMATRWLATGDSGPGATGCW